MAIKEPLISKAFSPLEGLVKIGVIEALLTSPKSKSLLLMFPIAI